MNTNAIVLLVCIALCIICGIIAYFSKNEFVFWTNALISGLSFSISVGLLLAHSYGASLISFT